MSDELFDISEAADFLGLHRRTVKRWVRQGRIRFAKLGPRTIRIRKRDLEDFVDEHLVEPGEIRRLDTGLAGGKR